MENTRKIIEPSGPILLVGFNRNSHIFLRKKFLMANQPTENPLVSLKKAGYKTLISGRVRLARFRLISQ